MAHIKAYGLLCPNARGIIHLGATSCFVGDNADIIIMRDALKLIRKKLLVIIKNLSRFAEKYKALPTLGYTHFQPAQLTTVGKRACLWINDLLKDVQELDFRIKTLKMRGVKGATGSQASFLELFEGDHETVKQLERLVVDAFGFDAAEPVTGQTYTRKVDYGILSALSGIAQSASKFATDIRLLQSLKEIEEPFESTQVGSSAMPYKRNPMRCERICGIARYLITLAQNPAITQATQWFERTLDDSSNRRISIPEAFLAADAICEIYANVSGRLVVYPKVIAAHVADELPFMACENILMEAVKAGGDRQELHEKIRIHSQAAGRRVKQEGCGNDLISRIARDPAFKLSERDIKKCVDPNLYIGRCVLQVEEFLSGFVSPLLAELRPEDEKSYELKV
jgi:adenylosuccinate lyase